MPVGLDQIKHRVKYAGNGIWAGFLTGEEIMWLLEAGCRASTTSHQLVERIKVHVQEVRRCEDIIQRGGYARVPVPLGKWWFYFHTVPALGLANSSNFMRSYA